MSRKLFAVMEDEIVEPVAAPEVERVAELEEQVAQADVTEAQQETEEAADTVEEAVAAVEELSDVAGVMEDSIEEGEGLTEDAAEIAEVAVESICARLGYKPAKKPIPSMESFGSTSSRLEATKYALEGISDTIKKIWEAIKGFFVRIWDGIKSLWKRLFDAGIRVKARAEKLSAKLKEVTDGKMVADGEKKLDVTKYCVTFNAKSAAELPAAAASVLESHWEAAEKMAKVNADLSGLFEKAEKVESNEELAKAVQGVSLDSMANGTVYAFGTTIKFENDASKDAVKFQLVSNEVQVQKQEAGVVELAKLSTILDNVATFQKTLEGAKAALSKAEAAVKKGMATAEKMAKEGKVDADVAKSRASTFKTGQSVLVAINTTLPSIGLKAASAGLDYVAANLGGYKAA